MLSKIANFAIYVRKNIHILFNSRCCKFLYNIDSNNISNTIIAEYQCEMFKEIFCEEVGI